MTKHQDFHLTLPLAIAKAVDRLARDRGMKRSQLLRGAVEDLLARAEREARDREMALYVSEMAPYSGEIVKETARHVSDLLLEETEW